jgi:hypothetical protein
MDRWSASSVRRLAKERLLDSLCSDCGIAFVIDKDRFEFLSSRRGIGTKGELPGTLIMAGARASGTYCGMGGLESCVIEWRAPDDEERCCCWILLFA